MKLRFEHPPGDGDAGKVIETFRALFPAAGEYVIERAEDVVAKAATGDAGGEGPFETWFLRELESRATGAFQTAADRIWAVLDNLLVARRMRIPSDMELAELRRVLFDLGTAATSTMAGIELPGDVEDRLRALGWTPLDLLDFPGLAYRMGRIYHDLVTPEQLALPGHAPMTWDALVSAAGSHPLSPAETQAIRYVRARAGLNLTRIIDRAGEVWSAERELEPLRGMTARVIDDRRGLLDAARRLQNSYRAQGMFRDAERVIRTEIAEGRSRGAWAADKAEGAPVDGLVFRTVSSNPCVSCLRLYVLPDGTPRPYRRDDLEEMSRTVNRGPVAEWTAKIGPTHPHCHPGGVLLERPADLRAMASRMYQGDLVTIRTRRGDLTVTPNHPVLTPAGWIPAAKVQEVGQVVAGGARQRMALGDSDHQHVPTLVEDILRSIRSKALVATVAGTNDDFHGDGSDGEVDIVLADGALVDHFAAGHPREFPFQGGEFRRSLATEGAGDPGFIGVAGPSPGGMRRVNVCPSCFRPDTGVVDPHLLTVGPPYPKGSDPAPERGPTDSVPAGKVLDRLAGEILLEDVVEVRNLAFSGHVFSLETESIHAYVAGGIVVSNCVCSPWQAFHAAYRSLFEQSAEAYRELLARKHVYDQAA